MGQRLNIEILKGQEVLANAYYHWSGYTDSAIRLTKEILECDEMNNIYNDLGEEKKVISAIKLLESTGAGLTEEEIGYAKNNIKDYDNYDFNISSDRNAGLIAISKKGINETRQWEEARVSIDILVKSISFDVYCLMDKEEYEDYANDFGRKYNDIPVFDSDCDINNLSFSEFYDFADIIDEIEESGGFNFRFKNSSDVYGLIA